jgi:hypothetical protein
VAKLWDTNGSIVGNFFPTHFFQHGFGSDVSRTDINRAQAYNLKTYQASLEDLIITSLKGPTIDMCVVSIWSGPHHKEDSQPLAVGHAIRSQKDPTYNKRLGIFIALNRAANKLGKKVVKRSFNYMVEDGTNLVCHKETRYVLMDR